MESVLSRYRNLVVLVGVLFLQVLGLAVQVKRGYDAENTRLIRIWAVSAVTPLEKGLVALQDGAGNLWRNYLYLRGVRGENRELKEQIEKMRLEQVRLSEDAAQARRLQALFAFKEQYISKTVAAQVIGSSGSDLSRGIYIDKGSDENIQPDMAVITADGIVGKILRVYPSTSLVLLINDQSSGVGAILKKTRLQGVLLGTPNGEVMLKGVMSDEQVPIGEQVLTSGGDQIFPKGLPVGTIAKVSSPKDLFLNITVKPSADLSKLEEVLVVLQKQERQAVAQEGTRARAADVLAQRLPSVPDQPAPSVNMPLGTPATTATGASGSERKTSQPAPQTSVAPSAAPGLVAKPAAASAGNNPAPPKTHTAPAAGQSTVPESPKNTSQDTSSIDASGAQDTSANGKKPAGSAAQPTSPQKSAAPAKSVPPPSAPAAQPTSDPDIPH